MSNFTVLKKIDGETRNGSKCRILDEIYRFGNQYFTRNDKEFQDYFEKREKDDPIFINTNKNRIPKLYYIILIYENNSLNPEPKLVPAEYIKPNKKYITNKMKSCGC